MAVVCAFKGKQVEMYDEEKEPVNGYGFRGTIQGTAVVCHCGCETTMKGGESDDQKMQRWWLIHEQQQQTCHLYVHYSEAKVDDGGMGFGKIWILPAEAMVSFRCFILGESWRD